MNHKTSFAAGLIFVVLAVLVFFALRSFQCPSGASGDSTISEADMTANITESAAITEGTVISTENTLESSQGAVDTPVDNSQIRSSRFTVKSVTDGKTDETLSPRVVLGSSYSEYYLSFDDKSGFELYLSSLGEIREGSYEVYDSVISVTYSDGKGAEFKIQRDDSGNLSGIIVTYGEYNVLFS